MPIPDDIVPIIEAWRQICPDTSPDALMFPTHGKGERAGSTVPRRAKSFLKWRIHPIAKKMKIPRRLVTFQVMRRTLGSDLQQHGTIKDAQGVLRHASIKTTGDVYVQQIRKACERQSTREHGQSWRSGGRLVSNRNMQRVPIGRGGLWNCLKRMAPQVGLEPTTLRLTAGCSAIELLRSVVRRAGARR